MSTVPVVSLILNAHLPFICRQDASYAYGEQWFFEALSETYIPLLEVFDRLEAGRIPFRLGIALSPMLCAMLKDPLLIEHYLAYTNRQIAFGLREMERARDDPALYALAKYYYDRAVDKRVLFTERYGKDILRALDRHQKKGRVEILSTAATHAFLPLYTDHPEAVQAQFEVAIASYRANFGRPPLGFWLPELGWSGELDAYMRAYNFNYTVVDTHGALLGEPKIRRGSFYPIKTASQVYILIRDFYARDDILSYAHDPVYRDHTKDEGFELPWEQIRPFLGEWGVRLPTGYKYCAQGDGQGRWYDPQRARAQAQSHARSFLDSRRARFSRARELMDETPISLCAFEADAFGRYWHEGMYFLESLFREGASRPDLRFMTPGEYLCKQSVEAVETSAPEFTSWEINGYGEMWLNAANDWVYRHGFHSLERMVELAERFPNESGLKERALNQAARELLLVQASDWPKMLYKQESPEYARSQMELFLRNFTTVYEALGSNYISTRWLTNLERRHGCFPPINYRIFRRKR